MVLSSLWVAPEVNPVNKKARQIPFFNPLNVYGRVFHFAWFGFFIAFWSWYAFPPLLADVIAKDIGASNNPDVLNSNIVSLIATLFVRVIAGPLCDRFGPRKVFAGCLLLGAIPTFCAGGVTNTSGLMAIRFFVGILGGSFVPCQVWTTGFFDKNTIGFANALTAGLGNAGGGVTYFVMPAVYESLMRKSGLSSHVSWRVSFVVPGILIVFAAVTLLIFCPDTPQGKWSEREKHVQEELRRHSMIGQAVPGETVAVPGEISVVALEKGNVSPPSSTGGEEKKDLVPPHEMHYGDHEAHLTAEQMYETAKGEVIRNPSFKEILHVFLSPQTFVTATCYFCSFGAELAINSILGSYYSYQFGSYNQARNTWVSSLTTQEAGNWAAMFGLLNIVFRPLGGLVSDWVYRATGNVWAKKAWMHACAIITGAFLLAIGLLNETRNPSTLYGLVAGMAFFLEAGNGANFSLVPHVHPFANGVISGFTGAAGNLGGIVFAIIFRYNSPASQGAGHLHYSKSFWIIGVMTIAMNLAVSWIKPIPKGQIGGH